MLVEHKKREIFPIICDEKLADRGSEAGHCRVEAENPTVESVRNGDAIKKARQLLDRIRPSLFMIMEKQGEGLSIEIIPALPK